MDFVWVCRSGANEELRYSVRSVVKHHPESNIILVGGKPDWYDGTFFPSTSQGHKLRVVKTHLNNICDNSRISADFVLMNDDFYLTAPFDFKKYYSVGELSNHVAQYGGVRSTYVESLKITRNTLVGLGKTTYSFETHVPIVFNKMFLKKVLNYRGLWRSLYSNVWQVKPTMLEKDVKIYLKNIDNVDWDFFEEVGFFSTEDKSFPLVVDKLSTLFPEPTQYELEVV